MRVLITTPPLDRPGGVATYFEVLAPHMTNVASYFFIGSRGDDEGIARRVARVLVDTWAFTHRLLSERPDLVHLNPSLGHLAIVRDGILLLVAKLFACPVVVFVHGWDQSLAQALKHGAPGALFRAVFKRADAFIVLASKVAEELHAMDIRRPIFLETTTVHDDLLATQPRQTKSADDPVRILFLARVERAKGIFEVLDAYHLLQQRCSHVTLTVAGDGSDLPAARDRAAALGLSVEFTGFVRGEAKLREFFAADVYLFASHAEGMPISVLEAMAAGLPVVTTCVGGLADFFDDGAMGFLLDDADPVRMAERLAVLVENPLRRRAIGNDNTEYARQRFAPAHVAKRLCNLYRRVINHETDDRAVLSAR